MQIAFIAMSGVRASNDELTRVGLTLPGFLERSQVIASLPSLGLLTLARASLDVPPVIEVLLVSGWILMPSTLALGLIEPRARYGLVVPASLVTVGLAAICMAWLPADPIAAAGWLLLTTGIGLGGRPGPLDVVLHPARPGPPG